MLKFHSKDDIYCYGDRNKISSDPDIIKMFFGTNYQGFMQGYTKVSFSEAQLLEKDRCAIQAWIARNIPYDVYCVKEEVKYIPDQEAYDVERQKIVNKSLFKKKDINDFDVKREATEKLSKTSNIWHFCFCDHADAVQFKLVWG